MASTKSAQKQNFKPTTVLPLGSKKGTIACNEKQNPKCRQPRAAEMYIHRPTRKIGVWIFFSLQPSTVRCIGGVWWLRASTKLNILTTNVFFSKNKNKLNQNFSIFFLFSSAFCRRVFDGFAWIVSVGMIATVVKFLCS